MGDETANPVTAFQNIDFAIEHIMQIVRQICQSGMRFVEGPQYGGLFGAHLFIGQALMQPERHPNLSFRYLKEDRSPRISWVSKGRIIIHIGNVPKHVEIGKSALPALSL
jgi:hypothetical protein